MNTQQIFNIKNNSDFTTQALTVFNYQYQNNPVYRSYCQHLNRQPSKVTTLTDIPFLPIEFFKSKTVICSSLEPEITFSSSGTTGSQTSKHYVTDLNVYIESFRKGFTHFYGDIGQYCVLALLPSYLERKGSSLILMADDFIKQSKHPDSGFYLHDIAQLYQKLQELEQQQQSVLLIGVSFALLDMAETYSLHLKNTIVMETGGMKGRRKEMIREELHDVLKAGFGVSEIHSEYGMTELLSQGYSKGHGIFNTPPWMRILTRDTEDPLGLQEHGKTGGINVIDLANVHSCSFIATQDLGKCYPDGSFEILGRFDHSDIRGCNLMAL